MARACVSRWRREFHWSLVAETMYVVEKTIHKNVDNGILLMSRVLRHVCQIAIDIATESMQLPCSILAEHPSGEKR